MKNPRTSRKEDTFLSLPSPEKSLDARTDIVSDRQFPDPFHPGQSLPASGELIPTAGRLS